MQPGSHGFPGMQMGAQLGNMMPMGIPMGMMGMPMPMGMMGMPMMMPMGMSHIYAAAAAAASMGAASAAQAARSETRKDQLVRALEAAGSELASKTRSERSERSSAREEKPEPVGAKAEAPEEALPRCHLHRKPSAACKFCRRAHAQDPAPGTAPGGKKEEAAREDEDYSRRTFSCSPMLKDQIYSSSYFKSLLSITTIEDLIEEIVQYADTLDVYNAGSTTQPSCFVCQVYRLFTLPQTEDLGELHAVLDYTPSAMVRCVGFLYMRFVVAPPNLFTKFEEYLFDDMELVHSSGGVKQVTTTIGEYVESLLVKDKYFSTPLPRIPVKVRQILEKELAPLSQYRKRMEANQRSFKNTKVADMPVEVCIGGSWVKGLAKELVGKSSVARKLRVKLDDGSDINVHLGKVVLRERREDSPSSESGRKRRGSRSRSRRKGSPDWSRFKGRSDAEMVEELRDRAREDAVCGHGRTYSKRPLRDDVVLATKLERGAHESRLLEEDRSTGHRRQRPDHDEPVESEFTRRRRQEEEDARQKRLRDIFEKYGSSHAKTSAVVKVNDVDMPDVLRLG